MANNKKRLEVNISSFKGKSHDVSISLVANSLNALQNIMYIAGDYSYGNKYRSGGGFPKKIKTACNLVFKDLKFGSFEGTIALSDSQSGFGGGTVGEQAFDLTRQTISVINNNSDISESLFKTIPDEFRVQRILEELDTVWPDEKSDYSIEMTFGNDSKFRLNPEKKHPILEAKRRKPKIYSGVVYGRLNELGVESKNKCVFDTAIGKITANYKPELEGGIVGILKKNVRIKGLIEKKRSGFSINIESMDNISIVDTIPFTEVTLADGDDRLLSLPVELSVEWNDEDQSFILFNGEFGLLAESSSINEGMDEINENLCFLYENYVLEEDNKLTLDAIELKQKLVVLFNGDL